MKKILVTGSNGQVGQEIQHLSTQFPTFSFHYIDIADLDITDGQAVQHFFAEHQPDYCINCAAYTAVDKAESVPDLAKAVNETGVQNLAEACRDHACRLLQLSTDYVYHNGLNRPLIEDDPVNPQSIYASTKLGGDLIALDIRPDTLVLRTSWVYSSYGHNFVKTMMRLGSERDSLGIVFDQIGTPTYARDLAAALLEIVRQLSNGKAAEGGVYHYSNEGVCSWYDFALAIFDMENITCDTRPIETTDYPTPAKRPPFSVLNKKKIRTTFGVEIPHWRESLKNCLAVIRQTNS